MTGNFLKQVKLNGNRTTVIFYFSICIASCFILLFTALHYVRADSLKKQETLFRVKLESSGNALRNWVRESSFQLREILEDREVSRHLEAILGQEGISEDNLTTPKQTDLFRARIKHRLKLIESFGYIVSNRNGTILDSGFGANLVRLISGVESDSNTLNELMKNPFVLNFRILEVPDMSGGESQGSTSYFPVILVSVPVKNDSGSVIGIIEAVYGAQLVARNLLQHHSILNGYNLSILDDNGFLVASTSKNGQPSIFDVSGSAISDQIVLRDIDYASSFSRSYGIDQITLPHDLYNAQNLIDLSDTETNENDSVIRAGWHDQDYRFSLLMEVDRKAALETYYFTRNIFVTIISILFLLAAAGINVSLKFLDKTSGLQALLDQSELRLIQILNSSKIGMVIIDRLGKVHFWCKRAEGMFGMEVSAAIGEHVGHCIGNSHIWNKLEHNLNVLLNENEMSSIQVVIPIRKSQSTVTIEFTLTLIESNGQFLVSILFRDISRRAGIEQSLRRSMQILTKSQTISNMGYWEYDIKNGFYHFSQGIFSILKIEEPITSQNGNLIISCIHPEDKMMVEESLRNWFKHGKHLDITHRISWDDGSIRHVRQQGFVYEEVIDNNKLYIGTIQDITEQVNREIELRHLSSRLQLATSSGNIGIWQIDLSSRKIYWDNTMYQLYGLNTEKEINWDFWSQMVLPEDYGKLEDDFEKSIIDKTQFKSNYRIQHSDGTIHYISAAGQLETDLTGKPLDMIGINVDVTEFVEAVRLKEKFNEELEDRIEGRTKELEKANRVAMSIMRDANRSRRKAEEALEMLRYAQMEQQKLLTAIISSPVAVSILDPNKEFEYANPMFFKLTGYHADEVYGRNFHFLLSDKKQDSFYSRVWRKLHEGGSWSGDMHCKTKENKDIWMHTVLAPILSKDGSVSNFIAILEDTTKQRQIQKRLEEALLEASSASKAKGEFLANISHEIRTPMNAILGFTDILAQKIKEPSLLRYMDSLKSSSQVLLDLINNILELSRLESGNIEINPETTEVRKIVARVTEMFSYKAADKGIELSSKVDDSVPPYLVMDSNRISQVLMNLIGNAVKFTNKGSVDVTLKIKEHKNIRDKVNIYFRVEDSGPGIEKRDLSRIFQSFEQVRNPEVQKETGTGLGLAITKRILKAMNGSISVRSKIGEGSVFTVDLPDIQISDKKDLPEEDFVSVDIKSLTFKKASVLVADDTESNREILNELFKDYPFDLLFANNGEEACKIAKKERPDIILMDIKMPVLDGFSATKKLKRSKSTKDIPVIALTGSNADYEATQSQNLWSGQLLKPVVMEALIQIIKDFLPHEISSADDESKKVYPLWNSVDALLSTCNRSHYKKMAAPLSDYGEQAKELMTSMSMDLIEEFALNLRNFSVDNRLDALEKLSDVLLGEIQMFEVEKIKFILNLIMEFSDYSFE